ncbi:hypothetical protein KZZ52_04490 [Dactylosporangium sp. AC04546]|uniref:hypothetical protein n=1 Tax=Dactylosporangium sp. AC04546 TaxID=2862460 RepID=UPI001EE03490|nr:hypothetical protein [Dactylosporangium sp. AC04546]WVK84680.1 hypothetical protein KZZ52_04490 [Dactylosporangium sp. AC04546]
MSYVVLASVGGALAILVAVMLLRRPTRTVTPTRPPAADLAFRRGWQASGDPPPEVSREVAWLWSAYHLEHAPAPHMQLFVTWSYAGLAGGLPVYVADVSVAAEGMDLSRYPGGGLVVTQLPAPHGGPVRVIRRPSGLLPVGAWRSGVPAFDDWFRVDAPAPGTAPHLLDRPIAAAMAARGDWNFGIHHNRLICLLTAPFTAPVQIESTVDTVSTLAGMLPRPLYRR